MKTKGMIGVLLLTVCFCFAVVAAAVIYTLGNSDTNSAAPPDLKESQTASAETMVKEAVETKESVKTKETASKETSMKETSINETSVKETSKVKETSPSTEATQTEETTISSNPSSYMYDVTDDKIRAAIDEGKNMQQGHFFELPQTYSNLGSIGEYMNAFIDTPYSIISTVAQNRYISEDRVIGVDEAAAFIDYNKLTFSFYISDGWARLLGVQLSQNGKEIGSVKTYNSTDGGLKVSYFSVKDIDFSQPATIKVFDKSKPNEYAEYAVQFSKYKK